MTELARSTPGERLVVVWRVTTRCNLSCGFCAYDRSLDFARSEVDEASAERVAASLAALQVGSKRRVHLSLLGGEPLSWRPLSSFAERCAELGLSLGVTTNGSALGAARNRRLLLERFDEVTVSVDGLQASHDSLRSWPGGFAQLERAVCALVESKRSSGRGPLIRVNTVLMRDNVHEFADLCRTLARWGVEELTFNRLGGRDRPAFYAAHRLGRENLERLVRVLPELREEARARGLRLRGSERYVDRLLSLEDADGSSAARCNPGADFLFLDERGRLAPCSFTSEHLSEPLLPAHEGELTQISRRFLARQSSGENLPCRDCPSTQVAGKFA